MRIALDRGRRQAASIWASLAGSREECRRDLGDQLVIAQRAAASLRPRSVHRRHLPSDRFANQRWLQLDRRDRVRGSRVREVSVCPTLNTVAVARQRMPPSLPRSSCGVRVDAARSRWGARRLISRPSRALDILSGSYEDAGEGGKASTPLFKTSTICPRRSASRRDALVDELSRPQMRAG